MANGTTRLAGTPLIHSFDNSASRKKYKLCIYTFTVVNNKPYEIDYFKPSCYLVLLTSSCWSLDEVNPPNHRIACKVGAVGVLTVNHEHKSAFADKNDLFNSAQPRFSVVGIFSGDFQSVSQKTNSEGNIVLA